VETVKSGVETVKSGVETVKSGVETVKSGVETVKSAGKKAVSLAQTTRFAPPVPAARAERPNMSMDSGRDMRLFFIGSYPKGNTILTVTAFS
jgi:hypothetical protein